MNCDEAFDALTDPTERDHSALRWHLEFCPRCREMREVLAPALAMFAEESRAEGNSSPASPTNRLPGLFSESSSNTREAAGHQSHSPAPFLTPEAVRIAEQTAHTLLPAHKRFAVRWIAVGVACLLTSLGLFFAMASSDSVPQRHSDSLMLANECLWTDRNTDPPAGLSEQASSRWVVLSCVACHLERSWE